MFGVVLLFFFGHTFRIILNLEDLWRNHSDDYRGRNNICKQIHSTDHSVVAINIPFWVLVSANRFSYTTY